MAIRNIVKIDEDKCNGCGDCVSACAEGAIQIIDGKAKLVSEIYCDGLGACLGHCPMDAITIEKRESAEFDEKATEEHLTKQKQPQEKSGGFVCPGTMARSMKKEVCAEGSAADVPSQLAQWPVQLKLVSPAASYFKGADLLFVADCVPFAMGDFHGKLLRQRPIAVGCPKLDDVDYYIEKVCDIITQGGLKSLTVVHMTVPCCSGLVYIAKQAIERSGVDLVLEDITIDLDGEIINSQTLS